MTDTITIEIDVSDESTACEVGYGILGRAMDIHENPHDDHEDTAIELKEIVRDLLGEYSDDEYWSDE